MQPTSLIAAGLLLVVLSAALQAAPTTNPATNVAGRLKGRLAPHPRLLLDADAGRALLPRDGEDPRRAGLRERVIANADRILTLPPITRKMTGRRLLHVSRDAVHRIATLALSYRLTGDKKYLEGATRTMTDVSAFADFNPSHFLDVAEMTTALAIGYDWLHADLSDADRATVRAAIVEKGLRPSIATPAMGWVRGGNNWNQVCNGGMVIGALAVAEDEPELARAMIDRAIDGMPVAMKLYEPDGGYPEGAGYWEYGTVYNLLAAAALESALGDTFGLLTPAIIRSADYHVQMVGPTGLNFNYSDSSERHPDPSPSAMFLAGRRGEPALLWNDLPLLDARLAVPPSPKRSYAFDWLTLIWAKPPLTNPTTAPATHYVAGGITPIAIFRSSWQPDAAHVAVKAGSPGASHAHMDVGAFVMDWGGVRWASDLGMQSYESLESRNVKLWDRTQDGQRWKVYRLGASAHNILTVNGQNQILDGMATITRSTENSVVMDLSPVYAGQLAEARRGVTLRPDGSVRIQDEIRAAPLSATTAPAATQPATTAPARCDVRWAVLTRAEAVIDSAQATLTAKGKTLRLRVVSPAGATLKIVSTDPPNDYDAKNPNTRLVTFDVSLPPGASETLVVDFLPGDGKADGVPVVPLTKW